MFVYLYVLNNLCSEKAEKFAFTRRILKYCSNNNDNLCLIVLCYNRLLLLNLKLVLNYISACEKFIPFWSLLCILFDVCFPLFFF